MKLMSGGWVWKLPAETEYVEIANNGAGERVGVTLFDANHERLELPQSDLVATPESWTRRVAA